MKKINKKLDQVSLASLSEKQSVRTTFRLSESSNNAIHWLIKTNDLKPKEVLDVMCSIEHLVDSAIEAARRNGKDSSSTKKTRKTFVISKGVLRLLNKYSEKHKLSRDLIVENLILFYKALLEEHAAEEKQREKKALSILQDFMSKAESVEKQLNDLLYDDSPILGRFSLVIVVLMNLVGAIESKLSRDVPIDPDDMSQS